MALFLDQEFETTVVGESGYVVILQKNGDGGQESAVFLSPNQLDLIFQAKDSLAKEALESQ